MVVRKFENPFSKTERKIKMIYNKRSNTAFTSLVFLSLTLGTFAPIGCGILNAPVTVVKGIGNLFKNVTVKSCTVAKDGTVKSVTLVKDGVVKTVDLTKTGVVTSAGLVKKGTLKSIDLAKAGLDKVYINKNQVKLAAAIIGMLALFRFFMKEPCGDPIRFDKEAFLDAIKDADVKEALEQAWYFIDDVAIGRAGKRSSIRVAKDGKKLDVRPGYWPIGLCGYTHMYVPAVTKALGFVIALQAFRKMATDGKDAWTDFMGYTPAQAVNALILE